MGSKNLKPIFWEYFSSGADFIEKISAPPLDVRQLQNFALAAMMMLLRHIKGTWAGPIWDDANIDDNVDDD